ncbi:MAG TPA: hypothetical protein VJL54_07115 [Nitrososphaera sp.]|nr:hypothetical protein [Nitrososphaera sp.]
MSDPRGGGKPSENLFHIMDGIIQQINNTKKIFVTLIVVHLIVVPAAFVVTFAIFGPPFGGGGMWWHRGGPDLLPFPFVPIIPIVVVLVWLGVGIRQWYLLSKWTKKYEQYKALQKKIDEKLDYDDDETKGTQ